MSLKEAEEARIREQKRRAKAAKARVEPQGFASWATKEDEMRKNKVCAQTHFVDLKLVLPFHSNHNRIHVYHTVLKISVWLERIRTPLRN